MSRYELRVKSDKTNVEHRILFFCFLFDVGCSMFDPPSLKAMAGHVLDVHLLKPYMIFKKEGVSHA